MAMDDLIATGNTAHIFVTGETVTKVYTTADFAAVDREASNQQAAHALGLPVPEVLQITEVRGKPALVMEYIPGETMLELTGDDWHMLPHYLARSIEIQRAMHSVTAHGFHSMRSKLEFQILQASAISHERKAELIAELDHIGPETSVCHGDFHLQNLIVDSDDATIIDWMDATAGNPILDACRSYVLYGSVSDMAADLYLREYCSQSGCGPDEILHWEPVIAAARLSEKLSARERDRLTLIVNALRDE